MGFINLLFTFSPGLGGQQPLMQKRAYSLVKLPNKLTFYKTFYAFFHVSNNIDNENVSADSDHKTIHSFAITVSIILSDILLSWRESGYK